MIQRVFDHPWIFLGLLLILGLLQLGVVLRMRKDQLQKTRAAIERRKTVRPETDRRWHVRLRKSGRATSSLTA